MSVIGAVVVYVDEPHVLESIDVEVLNEVQDGAGVSLTTITTEETTPLDKVEADVVV